MTDTHWHTDKHTRGHSIYRASIASRGKNWVSKRPDTKTEASRTRSLNGQYCYCWIVCLAVPAYLSYATFTVNCILMSEIKQLSAIADGPRNALLTPRLHETTACSTSFSNCLYSRLIVSCKQRLTRIVLYTQVDGWCDKQTNVVGRTSTVDCLS